MTALNKYKFYIAISLLLSICTITNKVSAEDKIPKHGTSPILYCTQDAYALNSVLTVPPVMHCNGSVSDVFTTSNSPHNLLAFNENRDGEYIGNHQYKIISHPKRLILSHKNRDGYLYILWLLKYPKIIYKYRTEEISKRITDPTKPRSTRWDEHKRLAPVPPPSTQPIE